MNITRSPSSCRRGGNFLDIDFGLEDADVGEVAVELVKVQTVADDEFVGNIKADVIEFDFDFTTPSFVQKGANFEAGGVAREECFGDVIEGAPGVHNVFDDEHMAILDAGVQVHEDANDAGGFGACATVRGNRHEIELMRNGERAGEVAQEHDAALEYADQERTRIAIIERDLCAEFVNTRLQAVAGDEDFGEVVFQAHVEFLRRSHGKRGKSSVKSRNPRSDSAD